MKKIYLLLLLSVVSTASFAQDNVYSFYVYTTSNSGLPSNSINDIKMSSLGTLWITTNAGLTAMSGSSFTTYNTGNSQIATNALKNVVVDSNNKVWASTFGEGLVLRNGATFTHYTASNSGLPSDYISGMALDSSNNLWLATEGGLAKFNGTTWTTYTTSNSNLFTDGLNSVGVSASNAVYVTGGNVLQKLTGSSFTTMNDGVKKLLKVEGNALYYDNFSGYTKYVNDVYDSSVWYGVESCLANQNIGVIDVDNTNGVWVGYDQQSQNAGLQRVYNCTAYNMMNSPMPDDHISAIEALSSQTLWIGTFEGGLVRMNVTDTPDHPMVPAPDPTLPQSQVISMFSGVYNNVPVDTWDAVWADAVYAPLQIAGNDTKKYINCNFAAIETTSPDFQIDAGNMNYFHADVWCAQPTVFKVKLVDFGANETYDGVGLGDDKEFELPLQLNAPGQWVSLHLPLAEFGGLTTRSNIAQLTFNAEYSTVYIDNVYFSTTELGTKAFADAATAMYPNPATDRVNFSGKANIEAISIVSMLGQQVLSVKPDAMTYTVDTSALAKGVYMVNIRADGNTETKKLIVR